MRISSRYGRFLGCILFVTTISLTTLFAQDEEVHLKTFLDKATEEIPDQPKPKTEKLIVVDSKSIFKKVTEDIPEQKPKARFISANPFNNNKLKIQLGYFKEKINVNKMIKKIKSKHDWPVYVKTENRNGTDFYRVMIVDISNQRMATDMLAQLKSDGLKGIIK